MCTAVVDVAEDGSTRLLAVRDEDPRRPWDDLGPWWPERYPGVIGVRDRRSGGAWLAADPERGRLAVLLNRADVPGLSAAATASRGSLTLESVAGRPPVDPSRAESHLHGFNLLEVTAEGASLLSWDGAELRRTAVPIGTHMVAHSDLDDPETARIAAWLPPFRDASASQQPESWRTRWRDVLAESAALSPHDDRAIIRDNRSHGYPTQTLMFCLASVTDAGVSLTSRVIDLADRGAALTDDGR